MRIVSKFHQKFVYLLATFAKNCLQNLSKIVQSGHIGRLLHWHMTYLRHSNKMEKYANFLKAEISNSPLAK